MEVWISKTKRPVKHKVAMRTLTFVYTDRGEDLFSSLGLPELEKLYRVRLERAERYQRRKHEEKQHETPQGQPAQQTV